MGKFFYFLFACIAAFVGGAFTALVGRESGMDVPAGAFVAAAFISGVAEMGGYFAGRSDAGGELDGSYGMTAAFQAVGVVLGTVLAYLAFAL